MRYLLRRVSLGVMGMRCSPVVVTASRGWIIQSSVRSRLERHRAIQCRVDRPVHLAEATLAEALDGGILTELDGKVSCHGYLRGIASLM